LFRSRPEILGSYLHYGRISFQPIRPREEQYDINYYTKEGAKYALHQKSKVISFLNPFVGIVQDYEADVNNFILLNAADSDVYYTLFDVHYYLADWRPRV